MSEEVKIPALHVLFMHLAQCSVNRQLSKEEILLRAALCRAFAAEARAIEYMWTNNLEEAIENARNLEDEGETPPSDIDDEETGTPDLIPVV